jgi:hypothetical protein
MIPGAEYAIVEVAKVRDYLLSPEHPVGRFKAVFFRSLGYARSDWMRLQADLLALCRSGTATEGPPSAFGEKYEVRGILAGPSGRGAETVTVWMVRTGESFPRFVTAYPSETS